MKERDILMMSKNITLPSIALCEAMVHTTLQKLDERENHLYNVVLEYRAQVFSAFNA